MNETDLINRFFARGGRRKDVRLGIGDDAAVLTVPPGYEVVAAVDTIAEGVHFPAGAAAEDVGYRALAVNVSDLAAMGAQPAWCTLALSLPTATEEWLSGFARGFFEVAARHDCELVGGDTVRGPLVVTVQVMGLVEAGTALRRSGAQVGDAIFLTRMTGDAAAGLELLKSHQTTTEATAYLVQRFLRPTPRVEQGRALRLHAHAAMDVSDGLLIDLHRLCAASGVGAELDLTSSMLSPELRSVFDEDRAWEFALGGGDDYELLYTMPAAKTDLGAQNGICIGTIVSGSAVSCRVNGVTYTPRSLGYDHFAG